MKNNTFIILTSDGNRIEELKKLAMSIVYFDNAMVIFVNQSQNDHLAKEIFDSNNIDNHSIYIGKVIPLSKARNIALRHIKENCNPQSTDRVLFSDDDCYYGNDFASYVNQSDIDRITICPVVSENGFQRFTSTGVRKLGKSSEMGLNDLMFYSCSISIVIPYKYVAAFEFNEKLGLGNLINQGEETDYLERIIEKHNPKIFYNHKCFVFHPRKNNYSPQVFFSLSYFLSNKLVNAKLKKIYIKYAAFFYFKYLFVFGLLFLFSRKRMIFCSCFKGIFLGVRDVYLINDKKQ